MSKHLKHLGLTALLMLTANPVPAITFDGFADVSALMLNGNASKKGTVLRLTSASNGEVGSAFTKATVNAAKFSTFFEFRISKKGNDGADGFVFAIQPYAPTNLGYSGGGLGYAGLMGNSIGIEFDTWQNGEANDPAANHIAIDTDGDIIHNDARSVRAISRHFDNGKLWYAWIDYDGMALEIRLSQDNVRPEKPQLKKRLDIPTVLGNVSTAYVGFTATTGGAWENHDILYWEYLEDYQPIGL